MNDDRRGSPPEPDSLSTEKPDISDTASQESAGTSSAVKGDDKTGMSATTGDVPNID